MQSVSVQPTLSFYLKDKEKQLSTKKESHPNFELLQNENAPSIIQDSLSNTKKTEKDELCSPPLEEKPKEHASLLKLVKKEPLEEKCTESHAGINKLSSSSPLSESNAQSKPKLLSLKIRKRKYRVTDTSPPSEQSLKKACTMNSLDVSKTSKLRSQAKVDNNCKVVKKSTTLLGNLSSEDEEMVLGYTNTPVPAKKLSLADLEHFEELKEKHHFKADKDWSVQQHKCTPLRNQPHNLVDKTVTRIVPFSPTFSPRKPTPTSFTHILEERSVASVGKHGSSEDLNTSVPLFSTPTNYSNVTAGLCTQRSSTQSVKATPQRTLFGKGENERMTGSSLSKQTSRNNFSFGDDFDMSELMDHSLLDESCEHKKGSYDLNRYLVLEATTQECIDQNLTQNYTNRYVYIYLCYYEQ